MLHWKRKELTSVEGDSCWDLAASEWTRPCFVTTSWTATSFFYGASVSYQSPCHLSPPSCLIESWGHLVGLKSKLSSPCGRLLNVDWNHHHQKLSYPLVAQSAQGSINLHWLEGRVTGGYNQITCLYFKPEHSGLRKIIKMALYQRWSCVSVIMPSQQMKRTKYSISCHKSRIFSQPELYWT